MCDGGVATWNRSSGPRPRAAHQSVVARPIEAWVWRTALGRPVVPELKTRTASSPSSTGAEPTGSRETAARAAVVAGSSRSMTAAVPRASESNGPVAASTTACRAPVTVRA